MHENNINIKRIELKKGESYTSFINNNEKLFLDLTIIGIEKLAENEELNESIAFIVFGGDIKKDKEIVVQRSMIFDIIEKALNKMESYEEYETCEHLINLQKKFSK